MASQGVAMEVDPVAPESPPSSNASVSTAKRRRGSGPAPRIISRRRLSSAHQRTQLTIEEKQRIIRHKPDNPHLTMAALVAWVGEEMGIRVHLSTLAKAWKDKDRVLAMRSGEGVRDRGSRWPEFEEVLVKWVDEYTAAKGIVTNGLLCTYVPGLRRRSF